MLVLGLMGSPRKNGNTDYLLSLFMEEADRLGAKTEIIMAADKDIAPCMGCTSCEKKGFCVIKDKMSSDIYPLFRKADVIVASAPIFFYNVPAQLKALIDRSQALWSRKYIFQIFDPGCKFRRGFLLSLGATKGKNLFDGLKLTTKYFFDAAGASFDGMLTYRHIEKLGDMKKHPSVSEEVKEAAGNLLKPLLARKKVLFACKENACRSQMAAAFAQYMAGDKFEVLCGGSEPADKINSVMTEVMAEKGIDMAFRIPKSIDDAIAYVKPDHIITMGCEEKCPAVSGAVKEDWALPDPADESIGFMRKIRDEIETRVMKLIDEL
jgi:protein-tyrosine-phosphatase